MNYKEYLYSKDWKTLRQKAIERDNSKCTFCNSKFKEVHHIKYPKRFKEDHIDNLLCVCDKCHRRLHGIKNDYENLFTTIKKRIIIKEPIETSNDYIGLDFSGSVDCGIPRGIQSREHCRKINFDTTMVLFKDYLPNMTLDKFKLISWKGCIGWVEDDEDWTDVLGSGNYEDFTSMESADIYFWIIKNKWGKK